MIQNKVITDEMLGELRKRIRESMSSFRLAHTLGVEEMAARIGGIYCPDKVNLLRAAALLHDITKELSPSAQKRIFAKHGVEMSRDVENAQPTQHAITAALEIPELYADFADGELIGAVRYHTTGRENMTLTEKILYLSDYIDFTRTYSDCKALRDMFWNADVAGMTERERLIHLNKVILKSFDLTVIDLIENGRMVSADTINARNSLMLEIKNQTKQDK